MAAIGLGERGPEVDSSTERGTGEPGRGWPEKLGLLLSDGSRLNELRRDCRSKSPLVRLADDEITLTIWVS